MEGSSVSDYLLNLYGTFIVSNVNPFTTQLTNLNSNINGPSSSFTPAFGDWIYYLFYAPTQNYVTPPSSVSSVNFVIVGGGSGGNSYYNNPSLAGGCSGAVCSGSIGVKNLQYMISVGIGGIGSLSYASSQSSQKPPGPGQPSYIISPDGGSISCSGGIPDSSASPFVSINPSNSLVTNVTNSSNSIAGFGMGGSSHNGGNGGTGLYVPFEDGKGITFSFGGGGGVGSSDTMPPGNGSNGSGGQGGTINGGGGGGGGNTNTINFNYLGVSQNGSTNGGNANIGGGGGGVGKHENSVDASLGGNGGNGLVMLYYQIPATQITASNAQIYELKTELETLKTEVETLKTELIQTNNKITIDDIIEVVKNVWNKYKK
jgi:hypothetical protein